MNRTSHEVLSGLEKQLLRKCGQLQPPELPLVPPRSLIKGQLHTLRTKVIHKVQMALITRIFRPATNPQQLQLPVNLRRLVQ